MISVQLSSEYELQLEHIAKREHRSFADIIQQALAQYFQKYETTATPYELGKDLFGQYGSGTGNLSQDYKTRLKERLHAKHAH